MTGNIWLQISFNVLYAAATYFLLGLGFAIIQRVSGFYPMSQAAIFLVGGYGAYALTTFIGFNASVAACLALLVAVGIGLLLYVVIFKPMATRRSGPTACLIASLGVLIATQNTVSIFFGDDVTFIDGPLTSQTVDLFDARLTVIQLIAIGLSALAACLHGAALRFSRTGLLLRAVASDRELAFTSGIPVQAIIAVSFGIGSFLSGLAAVLVLYDTGLTPTMGFKTLFTAITVSVLAGSSAPMPLVTAALGLAVAREMVGWLLPVDWQDSLVFAILVAGLIAREWKRN